MAANDDFPRGWTQYTGDIGGGPTAVLNWPALAGIQWVLTDVYGMIIIGNAATADYSAQLVIEAPFPNDFTIAVLAVNSNVDNVFGRDEFSWSGQWAAPVGSALALAFNVATTAQTAQLITATAMPV